MYYKKLGKFLIAIVVIIMPMLLCASIIQDWQDIYKMLGAIGTFVDFVFVLDNIKS